MSLDSKIAKNSITQIVGRLISTALGLFALVFMTHGLGDVGYGKYTTIIAFLQFVGIMIDGGLSLTANRLLGASKDKEEDGRIMGTVLTIRAVSAVLFLGIAPIVATLLFPYPTEVLHGIWIATLSFFAIAATQVLIPIFQKYFALDRAMLGEIAGRLILVGGIPIAAKFHAPLIVYVLIVTAGSVVTYAITRAFANRIINIRFSYNPAIARRILHITWPIAISILFNLVYLRTDLIILSWYRPHDFAEIGYYGAAYRVLDILTGIATAFMGIMLPLLTAAWVEERRTDFTALTQKAFNAFTLLSIPTMLIGVFLGTPVMTLVAPESFAEAGVILGVLIVAMTAVYFSTLFGHLIVVIDKQRTMIFGYAVAAVVGLTAYILTIPRYGVWGAAWSTVATEALVLIITTTLFYRTARTTLSMRFALKSIVAGLPMAVIFVVGKETIPVLLLITFGLGAYGIALIATRAISKDFLLGLVKPR